MNGSHQDQIFDNLAALCIALWARNRIQLVEGWGGGGGGGGGGRLMRLRLFLKGANKKKQKKSFFSASGFTLPDPNMMPQQSVAFCFFLTIQSKKQNKQKTPGLH